jgi:hypothetical protein
MTIDSLTVANTPFIVNSYFGAAVDSDFVNKMMKFSLSAQLLKKPDL